MYRAYNYNPPRNASVLDIILYEGTELGNEDIMMQALSRAKELGVDLSTMSAARHAIWATDTREQAARYGDEIHSVDVTGWVPLVDLGDEGMLMVLLNKPVEFIER